MVYDRLSVCLVFNRPLDRTVILIEIGQTILVRDGIGLLCLARCQRLAVCRTCKITS